MSNKLTEQQQQHLIKAAATFEQWYTTIQANLKRVHPTPTETTNALVTGLQNSNFPIHRWYFLKESYAAEMPGWLCDWMKKEYQHQPQAVLDPFMGSGTTGVSLTQQGLEVTGVEYNPFIRLVAQTKAAVINVDPAELETAINQVQNRPAPTHPLPIPALTTLTNEKYISPSDLQELLHIKECIDNLNVGTNIKNMLLLSIAASVDSIFNLRKDGRALRFRQRDHSLSVSQILLNAWNNTLTDVKTCFNNNEGVLSRTPLYKVYKGTAVDLQHLLSCENEKVSLADNSFDTIIYSPPYLNNFDYSEIYKLELWLLGFLTSYEEWKTLRLGTFRSHYSVLFPATSHIANDHRMTDLHERIQAMKNSECLLDKDRLGTGRIIEGYFDDMYLALQEQWRVLKPGGILAYVVANSRHFYLPIATDVIIAEIGRRLGFEPLDLIVMRKRNGRTRQKGFLRETVVFLKKPEI